jgi:hypothetical protein
MSELFWYKKIINNLLQSTFFVFLWLEKYLRQLRAVRSFSCERHLSYFFHARRGLELEHNNG